MYSIQTLPFDITAEIVSYLNVKDFISFTTATAKIFSSHKIKSKALFLKIEELIERLFRNKALFSSLFNNWNEYKKTFVNFPHRINGTIDNKTLCSELHFQARSIELFMAKSIFTFFQKGHTLPESDELQNMSSYFSKSIPCFYRIEIITNFIRYLQCLKQTDILCLQPEILKKISDDIVLMQATTVPLIVDLFQNKAFCTDLFTPLTTYFCNLNEDDKLIFTKSLYRLYKDHSCVQTQPNHFLDFLQYFHDFASDYANKNNFSRLKEILKNKTVPLKNKHLLALEYSP
ncbi:hypothetical protein BN1013_02084 [Candidatus Rubidus massiliensis]|nr:hypothetical protein BN1013_02084 [Candidatus Rubidus massiliensis]